MNELVGQVDCEACKSLFAHNPDGICLVDLTGRITACNPAYEDWSGYAEAELQQLTVIDLIAPEDRATAERRFVFRDLKHVITGLEYRVQKKNGDIAWISGTVVPILIAGELTGIFAITKDITEQRRLEQKLSRKQDMLAHLQRISRIGSWEYDLATDTVYWAEELCRIFGVANRETISTEELLQYVHEEDQEQFRKSIDDLSKGRPYDIEMRIVRPDGQTRVIRSKREIVLDDDGKTRIIGTTQDITEEKRTEQRLINSEKLSSIGQLAAGIAHEVRNPLTSITGFLQLLRRSYEGTDEQHYFDIIQAELKRIELVSSELLSIGKPQGITFHICDVERILHSVVELLKTEISLRNVDIIWEVQANCPPIMCAENQLRQAFINIIKNGLEAMPQGGQLRIAMSTVANRLTCLFEDSGQGMSVDVLAKVSDPFFTTKPNGNGLGLMITRSIVQSHNGSLYFTSQEGAGTTVTLHLPFQQPVTK